MAQKNTIGKVEDAIDKLLEDLSWIVDELYFLSTSSVSPEFSYSGLHRVKRNYKLLREAQIKLGKLK